MPPEKSSPAQLRLFTLFCLIAAVWCAALIWLFRIPGDPRNALLLGFSAVRLALAAALLTLACLSLAAARQLRRSPAWAERLTSALTCVPVFAGVFVLFVIFLLALAASFTLEESLPWAAYIIRLRPLLLGSLGSLAFLLLYIVVFGPPALRYAHQSASPEPVKISPVWQPPLALILAALLVYLAAGSYTEWRFMQIKPLPQELHYDFGYYMRGLQAALSGGSPYADLSLGTGFLYPPPSLLVVELFAHLPLPWLRQSLYLLFNLALLAGMVWTVARHYRLHLRQVWWWFPLVLGFAPLLEMLHAGQINMITSFGLLLLFLWEASRPAWGGLGLALAIVTKLSPLLFLAYLLANRRWQTALAALAGVGLLSGLAVLRYGWQPLVEYGRVFADLMQRLPLGDNPQSLVSRLFVLSWVNSAQAHTLQSLLMLYFGLLLCLSALAAYLLRVREPFFIITCLAMMLSANIMWYHHYVFILLPLLVWMAWQRLRPEVVIWCFSGLLFIQFDRWLLTGGMLAHVFGHASILWLLAGQLRAVQPVLFANDDKP